MRGDVMAEKKLTEIDRIILAAHALGLDAPIIHYRIVGDRIELWTVHGGPYIFSPSLKGGAGMGASPAPPARKKAVRKK